VTITPFAYEIRFYWPPYSFSGGLYQPSGSPFAIWRIENPDASVNTYNRLRITETRGSVVTTNDYTYTASAGSWKLDYPGGLREDERAVSFGTNDTTTVVLGYGGARYPTNHLPSYTRTETFTTRVPGGPDQYKVRRVYQQIGRAHV
jgi:hypothetical protein